MQRGGRRDDARKKAMERLDWLLEWITARQGVAVTFYGERPGNLVYRARKRCFHCRVPRSQVEGMPCSPMTVDYRGRQEATSCHGSRCSAVANKKLLRMPHSTVRERRASSSQDVIPARCTEDRVAAESGLTLWYLSPCALWSLSL